MKKDRFIMTAKSQVDMKSTNRQNQYFKNTFLYVSDLTPREEFSREYATSHDKA